MDAFASQYGDERQRQMQAGALAPALAGQDYTDINAMLGVGDVYRNAMQQELQGSMDRFNFEQQAPWQRLNLQNQIYSGASPYSQATQTQSGNPLMGAIGGGMLGYGAMQGLAGMTGGMVPGLAGMGTMGALLPWVGGGALLGGLLA